MDLPGVPGGSQPEPGEETSFAIHHMMPQHYGGTEVGDFVIVAPPPVDAVAATQPVNPGMPPLWHGSVPIPDAFRPLAPPLPGVVPTPPPVSKPPAPSAQPSIPRAAAVPAPSAPALPAEPVTPTAVSGPYLVEESPISLVVGPLLDAFDPLYALALFLAAGLGSFVIDDLETRYTLLWSVLLVMGSALTLVDSHRSRRGLSSGNMLWGLGIGLVIGLPLLVFAAVGLRQTSILLFPYAKLPTLFQTLVFLAPMGETVFYRGVLQERRGFVASTIGAGLGALLLYWPAGAASSAIGMVVGVSVFLMALAGVFSYVRQRFGLAAAYMCQVTLNLLLLFLPRIIVAARP